LDFSDCDHATLTYNIVDPSYSSTLVSAGGSTPLTRLGTNYLCSANGDLPASTVPDYQLSGAWYDPKFSYNGFVFDVDPKLNTFFAAWYRTTKLSSTSPATLSHRWYTLQTAFTPGTRKLEGVPIFQGTGGVMNDPTRISITQVGTAKLTFIDCGKASLDYTLTAGPDKGETGTLNLTRIGGAGNCNPNENG
jgi:hypothetical protein